MPGSQNLHYTHRVSYSFQERLVGVFVLLAMLLVILLFAFSREATHLFADKFTLYGLIENAQGIAPNSPVMAAGIEVGRVVSIDVADSRDLRIEMEILERFHPLLREEASAELDAPTMLGAAQILISSGNSYKPEIAAGSSIRIHPPSGMEQMMADLGPAIGDLRQILRQVKTWTQSVSAEEVSDLVQQLRTLADNSARISTTVAAGEGLIGSMLETTSEGGEDMGNQLVSILHLIEQSLQDMQPIIRDARAGSTELPALLQGSQHLVEQLNQAAESVNLQMEHLPELVLRTRLLTEQLELTLGAVQNTWPISRSIPPQNSSTAIEVMPLP